MGKPTGFKEYPRQTIPHRDALVRINDFHEFAKDVPEEHLQTQGARCMDCGVPFCQSSYGCPISNLIPEWNDLVYQGRWREAMHRLQATNNLPEITGRVCPAPCEGACVLGATDPAVTIKNIECAIADRGFAMGWIAPEPPAIRSGKSVAIVGSGPAGIAAADELNRMGHYVTIYERSDRAGGLLMYGIPNMKLDKRILERRIDILRAEGVEFKVNCEIGSTMEVSQLRSRHHAVLLAIGAGVPRDLSVPGRSLQGIHFAMEYLTGATMRLLAPKRNAPPHISARDKHVIVIGGGDTGNDCCGTAIRQGCASLVNFELLPKPPATRATENPWPQWPKVFGLDYGHAEAKARFGDDPRQYAICTKEFVGNNKGQLTEVRTVRVEWKREGAGWRMEEIPGSEENWRANLVFLALGFLGPERTVPKALQLAHDARGNIGTVADGYATPVDGVFAAGDCRRGQSLVVWAIREGREAARAIDGYLGQPR